LEVSFSNQGKEKDLEAKDQSYKSNTVKLVNATTEATHNKPDSNEKNNGKSPSTSDVVSQKVDDTSNISRDVEDNSESNKVLKQSVNQVSNGGNDDLITEAKDQTEEKDLEVKEWPSTSKAINLVNGKVKSYNNNPESYEALTANTNDWSPAKSKVVSKEVNVKSNLSADVEDNGDSNEFVTQSNEQVFSGENNHMVTDAKDQEEEKVGEIEQYPYTSNAMEKEKGATLEENKSDSHEQPTSVEPKHKPSLSSQFDPNELDVSPNRAEDVEQEEEKDVFIMNDISQQDSREYSTSVRRLSLTSIPRFSKRSSKSENFGIKELAELFS